MFYNYPMAVYLGADHRGFELKEKIKSYLNQNGYEVFDLGNDHLDPMDDYPDFGAKVGEAVGGDDQAKGILVCGSGAGVLFTANKFKGVRGTMALSADQIYDARRDDDVNVLSISANVQGEEDVLKIIQVFLGTTFSGEERHLRRINKVKEIEERLQK